MFLTNKNSFQNGWFVPHEMFIDEMGGFIIRWVTGNQNTDLNLSMIFIWDPDEGPIFRVSSKNDEFTSENSPEVTQKVKEYVEALTKSQKK
jgi:hypothetical protein